MTAVRNILAALPMLAVMVLAMWMGKAAKL